MNQTLKALREKFNYSQNSVANYLGISRQMYIKYEKGDVEPPLKVITNLSGLYKVPCELLIKSYVNNSEVPEQNEQKEEKSQAVYEFPAEKTLEVADSGIAYSADQMYYDTVIGLFKKMVFTEQLKVFAEMAGVIQKHSNEISDSMLETKKEDYLQKAFDLADVWNRANASKGKTEKWKWNREELYDREICRHRGE